MEDLKSLLIKVTGMSDIGVSGDKVSGDVFGDPEEMSGQMKR